MSKQHFHYHQLEIWAERGLINIVDERLPPAHSRAHVVITVREFLQNLHAFSAELKKRTFRYPDERKEYLKLLDDGVACARMARAQGRPDDPKAAADILRQRRNSVLSAGLPNHVKMDGAKLLDLSTGVSSSIKGALASAWAPENYLLPPVPQADPNKPPLPPLSDY